jgi:deoxyribonuclease V
MKIQNKLKLLIKTANEFEPEKIDKIAGVDVSIKDRTARSAVVILSSDLFPIEQRVAEVKVKFPYIPGLLAFRECPAVLEAFSEIKNEPDIIIVDGQGLAHPRRFGIASHIGVILDKPSIGCAKSRLIGEHEEPQTQAGSFTQLIDRGELIGAVVRTRTDVAPVYVSIGHKIDLETAISLVLKWCRGYRLPEPIRYAHMVAGGADVAKPSQPGLF